MSVRFDAATDRVSYTASNPPAPSTGFTITAWVLIATDQNNVATFARLHASTGSTTVATLATSSDGLGGPNYFTGAGSVTNATGFTVGAWRKVAWSASGTTGKSYVATPGGATEVDSGTVATGTAPTGITLGGRSSGDSTQWLDGRLAHFRVWSAELSQAEIEAEWLSTTPVRTSGLWADWPLVVHTDLTDHSGNGRNLVAGSTATTTEADPPIVGAVALAPLGALTAAATATRTVLAAAAAPLGALTSTAAATVTTPAAGSSTANGWYGLLDLVREAKQAAARVETARPVACPHDGEPLQAGPRGEWYCPYDGYRAS